MTETKHKVPYPTQPAELHGAQHHESGSCMQRSPSGLICTLLAGHDGEHAAGLGARMPIAATWDD